MHRLEPVVNRRFCSPIGLHRISLVRASGETFRRRFFDALEGARKDCPLGEQFCWHPVLPDPAPPPRRAPRREPPVVCLGFGLDRSNTSWLLLIYRTPNPGTKKAEMLRPDTMEPPPGFHKLDKIAILSDAVEAQKRIKSASNRTTGTWSVVDECLVGGWQAFDKRLTRADLGVFFGCGWIGVPPPCDPEIHPRYIRELIRLLNNLRRCAPPQKQTRRSEHTSPR